MKDKGGERDLACLIVICHTRPKPAYSRQGLGWDPQAMIQLGRVHFGVFSIDRGGGPGGNKRHMHFFVSHRGLLDVSI